MQCRLGGWQGRVPRCTGGWCLTGQTDLSLPARVCDHPSPAKDGYIEIPEFKGEYTQGVEAIYRWHYLAPVSWCIVEDMRFSRCNPGLVLEGNSTRTCLPTGEWAGVRPTCRRPSCPSPTLPPHTAVATLVAGQEPGATITYSCLPGYTTSDGVAGEFQSHCLTSGAWSPLPPPCLTEPLDQGAKDLFAALAIAALALVTTVSVCLATVLLVRRWLGGRGLLLKSPPRPSALPADLEKAEPSLEAGESTNPSRPAPGPPLLPGLQQASATR